MATLQQQVADKFLAKLAESKDVDAGKIEQFRKLLLDPRAILPRRLRGPAPEHGQMVSFASSAWRSLAGDDLRAPTDPDAL
jgi:hypothetical protein